MNKVQEIDLNFLNGHGLRPRAHSFALSAKDDRNFIPVYYTGS